MQYSGLLSRLSRRFYALIGIIALLTVIVVTGFAFDIGIALVARLPGIGYGGHPAPSRVPSLVRGIEKGRILRYRYKLTKLCLRSPTNEMV